jgi:hypothetical protein
LFDEQQSQLVLIQGRERDLMPSWEVASLGFPLLFSDGFLLEVSIHFCHGWLIMAPHFPRPRHNG